MMEYRPVALAMWLIKRIINIYVGLQLQYSKKVGSAPRKPVRAFINTIFAEEYNNLIFHSKPNVRC